MAPVVDNDVHQNWPSAASAAGTGLADVDVALTALDRLAATADSRVAGAPEGLARAARDLRTAMAEATPVLLGDRLRGNAEAALAVLSAWADRPDMPADLHRHVREAVATAELALPNRPPAAQERPIPESTREERDARLAPGKARKEARFIKVTGKLDTLEQAVSRLDTDQKSQSGSIAELRKDMQAENRNTRVLVLTTAVASTLAIIGVVLAMMSNMLSAYTAGLSAVQTGIAAHQAPPAAATAPAGPAAPPPAPRPAAP